MKRYGLIALGAFAVLASVGWFVAAARADDDAIKGKLVEYYRRKANIPPSAQVEVKDLDGSKIKGAKTGTLNISGRSNQFIISDDGKYAMFGELEDLTVDPFKKVMEKISLKDTPLKGPKNAKVTIVEYSDFQCPFCSRGYATVENQVLKEYGDKVKFTYKNFPLPMHPWAEAAAVGSECALQQKPEAFWTLYNFYFQNQRDITPDTLKAKSLEALKASGFNADKFTDCLDNKQTLDEVKKDIAEGQSVGVNGTPAFFISGRMLSGAQPFEAFKAVIDDELARGK